MSNNTNNKPKLNVPRFSLTWLYIIIAMIFAFLYFSGDEGSASKEVNYTEFQDMVTKGYADKIVAYDNNTIEMYIKPEHIVDVFKKDATKVGRSPAVNVQIGSMEALDKFLDEQTKAGNFTGSIQYEKKSDYFSLILWNVLPFVVLIAIWMFAMRRMGGGGGAGGASNVFNVGRSKAQLFEKGTNRITFKDVAGQAAAKQEVQEIVDFLKQPQRYTELGGKIPKGALLVGPPGTGKTLLAKAVAGEADVPFFSISGSDFVEMFVGVGASRVRDLFRQAKEKAPCIIFIDEIDAVGRARGKNPSMGGNDERENTLNQLLTEMDGFDGSKGVVILAATNRPDSLDPALTRPGRFDRRIPVELPDLQGREDILKVHARKIKIADNVNFHEIAKAASGASGAELANIVNEAALRAVRAGRKSVTQSDLEESIEVVIAGYQKKNSILTDKEKCIVAYHEIGHALVAAKQTNSAPVQKITIVPRTSGALGYTMQVEEGNHYLMSQEEMENKIATLTGGRAAEELIFHEITTGASNDIEKATNIARQMVLDYGFSEKLGAIKWSDDEQSDLGAPTHKYSARTAEIIDEEVLKLVETAHTEAWNVINENRDILDELVRQLLVKETLNEKELAAIFANIKKAPKREVWLSDEKRPDSDIPPVPIPDKLKKSAGLTN